MNLFDIIVGEPLGDHGVKNTKHYIVFAATLEEAEAKLKAKNASEAADGEPMFPVIHRMLSMPVEAVDGIYEV